MPDVMAKSRDSNYGSVIAVRCWIVDVSERVGNQAGALFSRDDLFKQLTGDVHHAKRVLEPAMRCAGVHQIRHRKLMDRSQPLHWWRVDDLSFGLRELQKAVDSVAHFQPVAHDSLSL